MNDNSTGDSHSVSQIVRVWIERLTEPAPSITDVGERFSARAMSRAMLVALVLTFISGTSSAIASLRDSPEDFSTQVLVGIIATCLVFVAYLISRSTRFQLSATLTALIVSAGLVFSAILFGGEGGLRMLYYLNILTIFIAIFSSWRYVIGVALLHIFLISSAPFYLGDTISLDDAIRGPGNFTLLVTAAVLFTVFYRSGIERLRQQQIIESESRYRRMIDTMSASVTVVSPDGHYLLANAATEKLYGYSNDELRGTPYTAIVHPDDLGTAAEKLAQLQYGIAILDYRVRLLTKDGRAVWVEAGASPNMLDGKLESITVISRDITARIEEDERNLQQALERERRSAAIQIVRSISHDFLNRLAIIETNRYLIGKTLGDEMNESIRKRFDIMRQQVDLLKEQIDNLRIVTTLVEPKQTVCDLYPLLARLADQYRLKASAKGVSIEFPTPKDKLMIAADEVELTRALHQLMLNAVVHTPDNGSIMIRAYHSDDGCVCAEIQDTGKGIEPEHLKRIFEPFFRPDDARSTDIGGVGVGLSMVRIIAEAYGGTVNVTSTPGQGSTFTLKFPPHNETK